MIDIDGKKYYTTNEISGLWNIKPKTVRDYCNNGLIPLSFKDKGKHYIPSDTTKPEPMVIKAALALCLLQSSRNISEDTLRKILSDPVFFKRSSYLRDINFITTHRDLGLGRFELTEQGKNYLSNIKKETVIGILKKHIDSIEFYVEGSFGISGFSSLTIRGGTLIRFRDPATTSAPNR